MGTFNRIDFIAETLDSIKKQTFRDWECLIIDDGSTDGSKQVIQKFTEFDSRFKYNHRSQNHYKGLPGCRNEGLEKAKGDYIVFFDDDDIVHPKNLEFCVSELRGGALDFCRYEREIFTGNFDVKFDFSDIYKKKSLGTTALEEIVMGEIPFNSCQVMWKKECFNKNKFNEKLMYAEEWECYLRILACGFSGVTVNKVLFFGRKHPNSNTGEFWNNNPVRRESKMEATKLVIKNLHENNLFSKRLLRYFIQLGIFLKEKSIVNYSLEKADATIIQKIKYSILYELYPIIGSAHRLKKFFKKKLS